MHYIAIVLDDFSTTKELRTIVESVTGKAQTDQTKTDFEAVLCDEFSAGLVFHKYIDPLIEGAPYLEEKKFFKMNCKLFIFDKDHNGDQNYAVHYFYDQDTQLVDGLKNSNFIR